MNFTKSATGILAGAAIFAAAQASALTIQTDNTITDDIPGLTGYKTTGAMMDGMMVTAIFDAKGFGGTESWASAGGDAGGVKGNNWSLTLDGDSYFEDWVFENNTGAALLGLSFDNENSFTVFDRYWLNNDEGTPDSAVGLDINIADSKGVLATYSRQVASAGADAVGDLWHNLSIDFTKIGGVQEGFTFVQDTDNDSRISVPAPGTIALLGLGLVAMGIKRRTA